MSGLEGGCACGAVRYRLASGPMFVNCCHCADCQRQVGSAFVINALIDARIAGAAAGSSETAAPPAQSTLPPAP